MEELPVAEVEHEQIPEPMFEESPFDFYEEKSDEFEAEKFTFEPMEPDRACRTRN